MSSDIYKKGSCEETGAYYNVYKIPNMEGKYSIQFYSSKRIKKPSYYLSTDIDNDVVKLFNLVKKKKERKAKEKAERKANSTPRVLKVDDILVCSWGYSMTLVDFYRVTELVGNCSVKIEEISSIVTEHDSSGGYWVIPECEEPGEPIERRFKVGSFGDSIMISDYQCAILYTGGKHYVNRND